MTPLVAVAAGAGFGVGVMLIWRGLRPPPPPLRQVIARLETPAPTNADVSNRYSATHQIGDRVYGWMTTVGVVDEDRLAVKLRVLELTPQRHALNKVLCAVAGFTFPLLLGIVAGSLGAGGVTASFLVVGLLLGIVGFFAPDMGLNDRTERRRRSFRHALSAYLDLVTVILAGGGGLETALQAAAESGDGWAFDELRSALARAHVTGTTPWEAFEQLGRELGVDELRELAASAYLAGDQGARIRASLTAKADSMRSNQTAAVEAEAEAATERMLLPVMALVLGMILFIGYGAVEAIATPAVTP